MAGSGADVPQAAAQGNTLLSSLGSEAAPHHRPPNTTSAARARRLRWGGSRVGDEVQAFSDFLFYVLDSPTLVAELAIAIFDAESGFVEVFSGARYQELQEGGREAEQRTNLITIKYVPGHYQALVGRNRPNLPELCAALDKAGVLYVITDG